MFTCGVSIQCAAGLQRLLHAYWLHVSQCTFVDVTPFAIGLVSPVLGSCQVYYSCSTSALPIFPLKAVYCLQTIVNVSDGVMCQGMMYLRAESDPSGVPCGIPETTSARLEADLFMHPATCDYKICTWTRKSTRVSKICNPRRGFPVPVQSRG